jgi:hypothetical protein
MDHKIKTLKLKLWQVLAVEPLTDAQRADLKRQRQWIYNYINERFPQAPQLQRAYRMYELEWVFDDILKGFSRQPMNTETFRIFQDDIRKENSLAGATTEASGWSTSSRG